MMYTCALLESDMKTTPWKHQLREFELSAEAPARALLWQMRTGKTKIVIDTACHLFRRGLIDGVLIFAPNGVHENWVVRELPIHMWDGVPHLALYWRTRIAGRKAGARMGKAAKAAWEAQYREWWGSLDAGLKDLDRMLLVTINSESMTRKDVRKVVAHMAKKRRLLVVWDESTDFRSPGSSRTLMSRALARRVPFRRILDGTSATNSPLHLFSQYELLEKGALGYTTYEEFKDAFAVYEDVRGAGGRKFEKLKEYKNLDVLKARVAPLSSVVLREDCSDLPPVVGRAREFKMTEPQRKAYEEMQERILKEIDEQEVPLSLLVAKVMKLQQIAHGFIIDSEKVIHVIPGGNPRLEALADEVFLAPGKVIIWCAFHHDMDVVMKRMALDSHDAVEYSGRVTSEAKLQARNRFQSDGALKALVGHPRSGGRGLELSAASTIIWYGHNFDAIIREQANERATKMGGGNVSLVDIQATPWIEFDPTKPNTLGGAADKYILNAVSNKVNVADDVAGRGLKAVIGASK